MSKRISLLLALAIISLPVFLNYYNPQNNLHSETGNVIQPISDSTVVSLNFLPTALPNEGESSAIVKIYGYTSPLAMVTLSGHGSTQSTTSDISGNFTFSGTIINSSTKEICLYAKDTDGRISLPTCVPVYFDPKLEAIGPIILAPTFTVAKSEVAPGEKIYFGGQSVPNRFVRINITDNGPVNDSDRMLTKTQIRLNTDKNGLFYFTTQSDSPQTKEAYSSIQYNGQNSPKSNTLVVTILPWWVVLLKKMLNLMATHALELALICEAIIAFLYFIYFRKKTTHPLAIYRDKHISSINQSIVVTDKHALLKIS